MREPTKWRSSFGYIFAMIGSAVGFANVLGFSAKCYFNGGGAFLIPLCLAFLILGVPLLILEGVIGKSLKLPLVSAAGSVLGRRGKFLLWPSILGVFSIGAYYAVINSWALAYVFFSASGQIPHDTAGFFHDFLGDSGQLGDFGAFSYPIAFCVICVMVFTYYVNAKDISQGVERVCQVFLPLLFVLLLVFLIAVWFLPGASVGFKNFLIPNFDKLLDPEVWLSSLGHAFFSLSVAIGVMVAYSRYTDESVNIVRSMLWVAAGDLFSSFVAGMVIFGTIGYLANMESLPFNEVVSSSTFGLGFVVFPKIIGSFPPIVAKLTGVAFFFSLFVAGITGLFSIIESVAGNVEYEFGFSRKKAVLITVVATWLLSLVFTWGNGAELMGAIDAMLAGVNVLWAGLLEVIVFFWLSRKVRSCREWYGSSGSRNVFFYALSWVSPLLIATLLGVNLWREFSQEFQLANQLRWAWFALAVVIAAFLSRIELKSK